MINGWGSTCNLLTEYGSICGGRGIGKAVVKDKISCSYWGHNPDEGWGASLQKDLLLN